MEFKERDEVDPFFYDPEAEIEYWNKKYNEEVERLYDEWKDGQIEKAMTPTE